MSPVPSLYEAVSSFCCASFGHLSLVPGDNDVFLNYFRYALYTDDKSMNPRIIHRLILLHPKVTVRGHNPNEEWSASLTHEGVVIFF